MSERTYPITSRLNLRADSEEVAREILDGVIERLDREVEVAYFELFSECEEYYDCGLNMGVKSQTKEDMIQEVREMAEAIQSGWGDEMLSEYDDGVFDFHLYTTSQLERSCHRAWLCIRLSSLHNPAR